jgi:hypothetical protein
MEATLGISLYGYLYLKLAKTLRFSYYLLCFSLTKSENKRVEHVLPGSGGSEGRRGRGEVTQMMHPYVTKCKNDKIKFKKEKKLVHVNGIFIWTLSIES